MVHCRDTCCVILLYSGGHFIYYPKQPVNLHVSSEFLLLCNVYDGKIVVHLKKKKVFFGDCFALNVPLCDEWININGLK